MGSRSAPRNSIAFALIVGLLSCDRRSPTPSEVPTTSSGAPTQVRGATGDILDGDVIFQESTSAQSEMVRALTNSRWTHMGVVFKDGAGPRVLEAVSPVRWTPLDKWIARGRDGNYVIKRLRDANTVLTPDVTSKMLKLGTSWLGRPYDLKFRWDDGSLYCSELVYKLFDQAAGIRVGQLQHASDMNLDDERVQQAIRKRYGTLKLNPEETVITPDAIFQDERLVPVSH